VTRALGWLFVGALAVGACAGPFHPVTANDVRIAAARFPGSSRESLEAGRHILLSHCGRCHRPFEPSAFRAERWPGLVREMAKPAGLDAREEELVVRYLMAASEGQSHAL
jgi:mono/diheme cytochrome c family protein